MHGLELICSRLHLIQVRQQQHHDSTASSKLRPEYKIQTLTKVKGRTSLLKQSICYAEATPKTWQRVKHFISHP